MEPSVTLLHSEAAQAPVVRRHRRHANPFAIRHAIEPLDLAQIYGRAAPLALDIGCGPGAFVASLAAARPELNVLGIEIRQFLVDETRQACEAAQVTNAHATLANVNNHLQALIPDKSVAFVSVNFPDPWFKKRHHKRRVVNSAFLRILADKLLPDAEIHAMTDYEPLAVVMRQSLVEAGYIDCHPEQLWPEQSTTGIASERENTHIGRGEVIWRMAFKPPADANKLA